LSLILELNHQIVKIFKPAFKFIYYTLMFNLFENAKRVSLLVEKNYFEWILCKHVEEKNSKKYYKNRQCKFECYCGNEWTTLKSLFMFKFNKTDNKISLFLFKQKCRRCNKDSKYFTMEDSIFDNFLLEIFEKLKGEQTKLKICTQDKGAQMTSDHDITRCHACLSGIKH